MTTKQTVGGHVRLNAGLEPIWPKCAMCSAMAEVEVSWPVTAGEQRHAVCDACGHMLWDKISSDFSGTEACMCFTIELLELIGSNAAP